MEIRKCECCGTAGDNEFTTVCVIKHDHAFEALCDGCAEDLGYRFDWNDGTYFSVTNHALAVNA